mmetsp:Transcript_87930/g.269035  ORF Transcript_87930/g.269035 Transcript_87930/m.269035 type:complete len:204 (+) Transcript_87930:305-916(+)
MGNRGPCSSFAVAPVSCLQLCDHFCRTDGTPPPPRPWGSWGSWGSPGPLSGWRTRGPSPKCRHLRPISRASRRAPPCGLRWGRCQSGCFACSSALARRTSGRASPTGRRPAARRPRFGRTSPPPPRRRSPPPRRSPARRNSWTRRRDISPCRRANPRERYERQRYKSFRHARTCARQSGSRASRVAWPRAKCEKPSACHNPPA